MKALKSSNIPIVTMVLSVFLLLLVGCASAPKTYTKYWYETDPATPNTQTKENITITVNYVDKSTESLKQFPPFYVERKSLPTEGGSWGAISNEVDGKLYYHFPGITIFDVFLKNDTGHILRMKDARIYLVIDEQTFPAVQKSELGSAGAPEDDGWRIELKQVVIQNRKLNTINDFSTEILPGMSYKGFLFFEIDPSVATDGKLSFFDITTKTDEAGNPTKKTTFEWKIIQKQAEVTSK